jgi:hypothetical protein
LTEGIAQLLDFGRGANLAGKLDVGLARLILADGALEPFERTDEQAADQQPGDQRCCNPHEQRQQQDEPVSRRDAFIDGANPRKQSPVADLPFAKFQPQVRAGRRSKHPELARVVMEDDRRDIPWRFQRGRADFGGGHQRRRHPADHADAHRDRVERRRDADLDRSRRDERQASRVTDLAGRANRLSGFRLQLKVLGDPRDDRKGTPSPLARAAVAARQGAIGRHAQGQGVARDQAFDRRRGCA